MRARTNTLKSQGTTSWTIELEFDAPDAAAAETRARAIAALVEGLLTGEHELQSFPQLDDTWPAERLLRVSAGYAVASRKAGSAGFLYFVLVAIRTGALRYETGVWKGGLGLLQRYPATTSKSEISKAATVILGELPHILSKSIPTSEAVVELAAWLSKSSWTTSYDQLKTDRVPH